MKKIILMTALAATAFSGISFAADDPDKSYIRNSLYIIKLDEAPTNAEYKEASNYMNATFDTIQFARNYERYNDIALAERHIDFAKLPEVTAEEIKAYGETKKKGGMGLLKAVAGNAAPQTASGARDENEYVAKLMKYFEAQHTANKIIARFHCAEGEPEGSTKWDNSGYLIFKYAMKGASAEAQAAAKALEGQDALAKGMGARVKLLSNCYVCVIRYSYTDAKEYAAIASAAVKTGASLIGGLGSTIASAAVDVATSMIKGYFVKANAYLFQLDMDEATLSRFYTKYWNNPEGFMTDTSFKMKYVGKSSKFAPATLTMKASATTDKLIARATVRGTDAAIAALQRDHENFRPMSALHVADDKLAAFIGMKEGVKDGDKFDVFEAQASEKDPELIDWKKVGTVKVEKGCVWDNRSGAGIELEGAATDKESAEKGGSTPYTVFHEKPGKKIGEGCMIRLAK